MASGHLTREQWRKDKLGGEGGKVEKRSKKDKHNSTWFSPLGFQRQKQCAMRYGAEERKIKERNSCHQIGICICRQIGISICRQCCICICYTVKDGE